MNRADLIYMLNVSVVLPPCHGATENQFCAFERFAELVASAERDRVLIAAIDGAEAAARKAVVDEREACAKIADEIGYRENNFHAWDVEDAIRARGQHD